MSRTRTTARQQGSAFERQIADYLATSLEDDRIDRRVKTGANDKGDIAGLRHMLGRIVVECKNYAGRLLPAEWTRQAEVERGNDDALAGIVIAKRKGTTNPADQWVLMTLGDYVAHLNGDRQHLEGTKQ